MAVIPGLNYVESTILRERVEIPQVNNTENALLVIGTARKGKSGVLQKVTYSNVAELYGDAPSGAASDFDTNITHAVSAILASTADRQKDVYVYKVGDGAKAKLELYEMQAFTSGDLSWSVDDFGNPIKCMIIESRDESEEGNNHKVIVKGTSNVPTSVTIELANGYQRIFTVDPYGVSPGVPANVKELVDAINQDGNITEFLDVRNTVLQKTNHSETVQISGTTGLPYISVDSPGTLHDSWSDKLVSVDKVSEVINYTEKLTKGDTVYVLKYTPNKDTNPATATLSGFRRTVEAETIISATSADIGKTSVQKALYVTSVSSAWDNQDSSINVTRIELINGSNVVPLTPSDYSISSGVITVNVPASARPSGLQVGDVIEIDYSYGASLTEANTKSELVIGNENSYFVAGNKVTFGAAQSLDIEVTYTATKVFDDADINITSFKDIIIEFINPDNAPASGATVTIDFTYLPELPAPSGEILLDSSGANFAVQGSALKGGTAGNFIDKQRYYELVEKALDDTLMRPFRRIIVAGAWLDDVVDGIDEETGLPGKVRIQWELLLSNKLEQKSQVAGEVTSVLGVKPLPINEVLKGESRINEWTKYLLTDTSNPYSAASVMASLDSPYLDIALGCFLCSDPQIMAGAQFVENPAYVLTGMQLDSSLEKAVFTQFVPQYVKKILVPFQSGALQGQLNNARYNAFVLDGDEIKLSDSPTAANPTDQLARQIVRDTVFTATKLARSEAKPFIGSRRNRTTLDMMRDKVNRSIIDVMVPQFLNTFRAELVPVQGGHITGETKLRLFMETSVEIRRVYLETKIQLGPEGI